MRTETRGSETSDSRSVCVDPWLNAQNVDTTFGTTKVVP